MSATCLLAALSVNCLQLVSEMLEKCRNHCRRTCFEHVLLKIDLMEIGPYCAKQYDKYTVIHNNLKMAILLRQSLTEPPPLADHFI